MEDQNDERGLVTNEPQKIIRCLTLEISRRKKIGVILENNKVVSIEATWKNAIDLKYLNTQLQSLGKRTFFMDGQLKSTLEVLIQKQGNRLLGGGCGASANQRIEVPEKKSKPTKATNPITAAYTPKNEASNSKDQDFQAIQQNVLEQPAGNKTSNFSKKEQQPIMNSKVTALEKKVQSKRKQSQLWKASKNSNFKIDPQFLAEFTELTDPNKVYANLGVKQSSGIRQDLQTGVQSDQDQQIEDDDSAEEVNLQAEITKIEDCVHKYRKGFGDSIMKYSPYYIELFELILSYQLIGVCQQYSSSSEFVKDQKNKLIQLKDVCVSQKEKQPALDIIFYLDFIIRVKGTSFPRTDDFKEVINAVKKSSARLFSFGIKAAGMVTGNFKDGFEEIFKLSQDVVSIIQEINAKILFKVILRIYIEKMNFLESQQQKQIATVGKTTANTEITKGNKVSLEEEILFYIEKFNNLIETDKKQIKENLVIYLMLRINYLLSKIQENPKRVAMCNSENLPQISFEDGNVIRFVNNLIVECEGQDFTDSLKGLISMSAANYLRFASLSLQIRLRKIFSKQQNSEKSQLLRLLQLNIFRWYMNETQSSIKILLYDDEEFQSFVHPADNQKLGILNELFPGNSFYEEYLNYEKDRRHKIGQYIDLGKSIVGTGKEVSQVVQIIEENLNVVKEIADQIL